MPRFRDAQGNIWEATGADDPNPVFVSGPQAPGGAVVLPAAAPKPETPPARTAPGAVTEGLPAGLMWRDPSNPSLGVIPVPGAPDPKGGTATAPDPMKLAQFRALEDQIARVELLYQQGPGATKGAMAIKDYLPSDANSSFDSAAAGLGEVGLAAFRVPGVGSQSDAELRQFVAANTPSASDRDAAIREKLGNLRRRLNATQEQLGIPAQTGNAMTALRMGSNMETQAIPLADSGSGQKIRDPNAMPPGYVQEVDALTAGLVSQGGGRLDPQAFVAARAQIDQKYGMAPTPPEELVQWATSVNDYLDSGGTTIPSGVLPPERIMSAGETARNNLINNPLGAAIIGASNGITAGAGDAFAPEQMMAMRDAQGGSMLAGEIGGAIGSTMALGAGAGAIAGRTAPALLQGGARGQFARNIATDATYGAAYGQNTQGDPLTGAVFGAGGSALGQGAARGIGAAVGGLQRTAAAEALRNRGVPISVARQLGLGRVEDLAQSIPFVGDASRARQMDSFAGFNQAAFQEGAAPIGASIPPLAGRDGIDALEQAVGDAYTGALGGRSVPLDAQFGNDLTSAGAARFQLPDDIGARADKLIENHINPMEQAGSLTGEMYQRARRGLGKARNNANQIAGEFDEPYRETMTGVLDAYDGLLTRGGGQDVIEGLNAANAANKNLRILEDASLERAKVGTQAGEVNVFTPAQLLQAARKSEAKYGGGAGLRELAEQGQEVLPSTVPNSGTADRMLFTGLLGGAGIVGGGAGAANDPGLQGAATGGVTGVGTAGAAAALAALLGTRGGQRALEQILLTRPQVAQRAGQGIRRRGGLFGSAGGALAQQGY